MATKSRLLVVLIFVVALCLGGYSWWHTYQRGRRSLQFWGSSTAMLIRYPQQATLLKLSPHANGERATTTLDIGGQRLFVVGETDLTQVPGFVHARHALVEDASFDWSPVNGQRKPKWEFALRFSGADGQATVAFAPNSSQIRSIEGAGTAQLQAAQMQAFDRKRREWSTAGRASDQ